VKQRGLSACDLKTAVEAGSEIAMRKAMWALMVGCAASAAGAIPAAAQDYPFCIKGLRFRRRPIDCSFSSYQQCQASASGRDAYCAENPYFTAKAELQPDRSRQSRRRY
jgi:Protein of unknown function (DUF3551)